MLTTVPYYRIPRDEDGHPSRLFDHAFTMALRWHAEIDIPDELVSSTSKKRGEPPVHAGEVALKLLRDANDISQRQLDAAVDYLAAAINFYTSDPWEGFEPYPGRNHEAATDLINLLNELTGAHDE